MEKLQEMSPDCARSLASADFVKICLEALKDGTSATLAEAWAHATQLAYFDPVGIEAAVPFSWSAESVSDIKARNPSLQDTVFMLPADSQRPFPIIGAGLVGPAAGAGYSYEDRNMTLLEISALYVGQMRTQRVEYKYRGSEAVLVKTVGGAVEAFAFSVAGQAPTRGLSGQVGELLVPQPLQLLDLKFAAGASGYAEGAFFESLKPHNVSSKLGMHTAYWSPVDARPQATDTLLCDGGSFENILLPSMLQRGVQKIVLFFNSGTPLLPSSAWNVAADRPSKLQVDDGLSSLFGVIPEDYVNWEKRSFDFRKNQFFSTTEWVDFATDLQRAQQAGNGIIVTKKLRTIQNDWWGVPAGVEAEVTFVYLGRVASWEAQLSEEMRALLVPEGAEAEDLSNTVQSGPFRHFPHYPTSGGLLSAEQANVLADLMGWTILHNAALFESILS